MLEHQDITSHIAQKGKIKKSGGKKIKPTHREKRTNKQNFKTIDKTNINQIGTQKEIYTYQKEKRKKQEKSNQKGETQRGSENN